MEPDFDFDQIKFDGEPKLSDPAPKSPPVKKTSKSTSGRTGRPTKNSQIAEMKEEIAGLLMIIAMPLKMRDIHPDGTSCGDVFININAAGMQLTPEADRFADALATVGIDNKFIKKFFEMGDGASKYLMLAMATQPLVVGIASNHMGRRNHNATGEGFMENS